MRTTVYHLIGPPSVGKYTIAKELAALTGARLIDNHSVANVIFQVLNQDGIKPLPAGVWSYVGAVRRSVLEAVKHLSPPELSFVFTNYLRGGDPAEVAMFDDMVALAEFRGSVFVPVLIRCQTSELVRRVGSDSRRERMKLLDPVEAARLNDEVPPFATDHPNQFHLDSTHLSPGDAAREIAAWAETCAGSRDG